MGETSFSVSNLGGSLVLVSDAVSGVGKNSTASLHWLAFIEWLEELRLPYLRAVLSDRKQAPLENAP